MSITRQTIRDGIIERARLGGLYTLTSGAAGYIIDNQELMGPHSTSLVPRGSPVRVRDATTAGVFEDSFADAYNPATGQITLLPVLADFVPAAADTAEVWLQELGHTKRIDEIIDLALTEDCGAWVPFVLTRVTDGDMETASADIATSWKASSTGTVSKVAASFPHRFARQALRLANAGAAEYAYPYGSAAVYINVVPGDTYRLDVLVRAAVSTATIVIYDQTNGAAITLDSTATDTTQKAWMRLYSTFTIPSGCYQIAPRLTGTLATADVYWTALSIVRHGDTRISLPTRITHMNNIGKVYQRLGTQVDEFYRGEDIEYDIEQVENGFELILPSGCLGGAYPVYAEEWKNYASLSTDTATTTCDEEYVVAHVCRRLFQRLWLGEERNRSGSDWANKWDRPLKEWRATAIAMDEKHRGGYRPRLRFPGLVTTDRQV